MNRLTTYRDLLFTRVPSSMWMSHIDAMKPKPCVRVKFLNFESKSNELLLACNLICENVFILGNITLKV